MFFFFFAASPISAFWSSGADCGEDFRHSYSYLSFNANFIVYGGESGKVVELKFTKSCVSVSSIYPSLHKSTCIDV